MTKDDTVREDRHEDLHPDWNDLAVLVESGPEAVPAAVLAHVAVCPHCLASWGEAVEGLDRILADAVPEAPPAPVRLPVRPRRRQWVWATTALAAAAVLLVLLLPRDPETSLPGNGPDLLRARLSELSADGPVYPGVARLSANGDTRYRAGNGASAEADALLAPWQDRFAADPADSDAAYWLTAGHLAAGRLNFADGILRRALQRHPDATALRHLDAITAYRMSDLERAEATLAGLLADNPDDDLARFNQALVLSETGRVDEAVGLLEALAGGDGSEAVKVRAARLLEELRP
jgi:tetratricopeptide (TPR) repeat protein